MSTVGYKTELEWSSMKNKWMYGISPSGHLCLNGDPGPWIENNPAYHLSVRCLELNFGGTTEECNIADSIKELAELTHLYMRSGKNLKCLLKSITRLQKLHVLQLEHWNLKKIPANIGQLKSLKHLSLSISWLKSISSVTRLHNLQILNLSGCWRLKELPPDLGDLEELCYIGIRGTEIACLPGSITKLHNLRFLLLRRRFRLETLPRDLNELIIIAVPGRHNRIAWKELKKEIPPLSFPLLGATHKCECSHKGIHCPNILFPCGYLRLKEDPGRWIHHHYDSSRLLVRFLDLDFSRSKDDIADSIGDLKELTHLYIYGGFFSDPIHLPSTITRLQKLKMLSVEYCDDLELPENLDLVSLRHLSVAVNSIASITSSLEKLSNLETLNLQGSLDLAEELPENLDKLVSLRHLSIRHCEIESLPACISKLSNLQTLALHECPSLKVFPVIFNLKKLRLTDCSTVSLPTCLSHLEIIHSEGFCNERTICDIEKQCLDQSVNLETLSITCYGIKFIPNIVRLRNLQELHLKDCFRLGKLPANLGESVSLCFLDMSGTRIKSLPDSITKLHNLRCLILPKCFRLESLSCHLSGAVKVSVDDMDDTYYKTLGYDRVLPIEISTETSIDSEETSSEDAESAPYLMEGVNEVLSERIGQNMKVEPVSHHGQPNPCDAGQETSAFLQDQIVREPPSSGSRYPIAENNQHTFFSLCNPETDFCHLGNNNWMENLDGNTTAESCLNQHETDYIGVNSQDVRLSVMTLQHDLAPFEHHTSAQEPQINSQGENNHHTLGNEQNNKSLQNDCLKALKGKNHKKLTLEDIQPYVSRNMTLEDAAKELGVGRSTMKRRLKESDIKWPQSRLQKKQEANKKKQNIGSTLGNSSLQPHLVNATDLADNDLVAECLRKANQFTLPNHASSQCNFVNLTPNGTLFQMNSHQHPQQHLDIANERTCVRPTETPTTFTVKATYNEDTVRFNFSLNSSIDQLKEELGKRLEELEKGRFKIKYQDDDKEWILMTCIADLEHALLVSKSSGSDIVRLSITNYSQN